MNTLTQNTFPDDHPAIVKAMRLYDEELTNAEKRNVYLTTIRAIASAAKGGDPDHLARFAESMAGFIARHSDPAFRAAVRESRSQPPASYEDGVALEDVVADLRGDSGGDAR